MYAQTAYTPSCICLISLKDLSVIDFSLLVLVREIRAHIPPAKRGGFMVEVEAVLPGLRWFLTLAVSRRQCRHTRFLCQMGMLSVEVSWWVTGRRVQILTWAEPSGEGRQGLLHSVVLLRRRKEPACPLREVLCPGLVCAQRVMSWPRRRLVRLPWPCEDLPPAPRGVVVGNVLLHPGKVGHVNFKPGSQIAFYTCKTTWVRR